MNVNRALVGALKGMQLMGEKEGGAAQLCGVVTADTQGPAAGSKNPCSNEAWGCGCAGLELLPSSPRPSPAPSVPLFLHCQNFFSATLPSVFSISGMTP